MLFFNIVVHSLGRRRRRRVAGGGELLFLYAIHRGHELGDQHLAECNSTRLAKFYT